MRLLLALLLLAGAAEAAPRGWDLRLLTGANLMLTTGPGFQGVDDVELGLTIRAEVRDPGRKNELKLDFRGREGFIGNAMENNLYQLSYTRRGLGILDLTIGRFPVPGGFWLVADGAKLELHYASWLTHAVYGGLRAFTTGRRPTWMSSQPLALPLAGTAFTVRHRVVTAQISFAWARDSFDELLELVPDQHTVQRRVQDEFFLDGYVAITPHDKVWLAAGASLGTRYDVQLNSDPTLAAALGVATLGAVGAYGTIEYRPLKRLRLAYQVQYERVRLIQSQLLVLKPDGTPVQTADGSFVDQRLALTGLIWRGLRAEGSYRLRLRENTDVEHRLRLGLRGDNLFRGLGGFVSVGVDINTLNAGSPITKVHNRAIYDVGLSFIRAWADLRLGLLYTDGIGSGLLFGTPVDGASGVKPVNLFPYILESNRVVYLRFFATFWKMYAGLDLEENIEAAQLRMMAQIGAAL